MYSKIKFKMTRNNQLLIDGESNLKEINNKYIFSLEGSKYVLDTKNKVLTKEDKDFSLSMDFSNNLIVIRPVNSTQAFDINLENVSYKEKDNNITIYYEHDMETRYKTFITINLY